MDRKVLLKIVSILYKTLTHMEFVGLENVPPTGGIILATNHMSRADVPLLFITPNRTDITALVADKYKKHFLFSIILNAAKIIWLDRDKADFSALSTARLYIQQGGALGIAPEGTRSKTGALIEGKPGTALLAARAKCPIIPVAITGTEDVFKKLLTFRRPKLVIRYGKPFTLPPFTHADRSHWLEECTEEIMCRIAAMLPAHYHGFYKKNPRLLALLNSSTNQ